MPHSQTLMLLGPKRLLLLFPLMLVLAAGAQERPAKQPQKEIELREIPQNRPDRLANTTWYSTLAFGVSPQATSYTLMPYFKSDRSAYGRVHFTADGHFRYTDSLVAGATYFASAFGTYQWLGKDTLQIRMDSVVFSGDDPRGRQERGDIQRFKALPGISDRVIILERITADK